MRKYGFTIIELLITIAIIGILSVIGLTELRGVRESARDAVRLADLSEIRIGLALYNDDNNHYPVPVAINGAGPDLSMTADDGTIFSKNNNPLYPGYISRPLVDSINKQAAGFYYYYDTNENPGVDHRNYVFCFHKEGEGGKWFYFYSTGVYGQGDHCPTLPQT